MVRHNDRSPLSNYQRMGRKYGEVNDVKPIHLYHARPHLISLYPEDKNILAVLDLGCGTGFFGQEAKRRWPSSVVHYLDGTNDLLDMAQEKGRSNDHYHLHDMEKKMDFFKDEMFDFIVSGLAIHYVKDFNLLFKDVARVMKKGATFILSTHNPVLEYSFFKLKSYFDNTLIEDEWKDVGGKASFYHHTFQELFNSAIKNGLILDAFNEPLPNKEMEKIDPTFYKVLMTTPHFLFIRFKKN